ncbi:MAG: hypothetical protein ACXV7G_01215 [Halobacteriota archaeon]
MMPQERHGSPTWKKMYHYFEFKHEEFLEHYHKRSNAETTFLTTIFLTNRFTNRFFTICCHRRFTSA